MNTVLTSADIAKISALRDDFIQELQKLPFEEAKKLLAPVDIEARTKWTNVLLAGRQYHLLIAEYTDNVVVGGIQNSLGGNELCAIYRFEVRRVGSTCVVGCQFDSTTTIHNKVAKLFS